MGVAEKIRVEDHLDAEALALFAKLADELEDIALSFEEWAKKAQAAMDPWEKARASLPHVEGLEGDAVVDALEIPSGQRRIREALYELWQDAERMDGEFGEADIRGHLASGGYASRMEWAAAE